MFVHQLFINTKRILHEIYLILHILIDKYCWRQCFCDISLLVFKSSQV